ncbi:MAG TPA: fasciclin domain-containing protein [Bacteroidales bacterium]|nr:fasciclin domain-containing protein [Bacteroidales bacterium]
MKKLFYSLFISICAIIGLAMSCDPDTIRIDFEDVEKQTIYDYIVQHKDTFSSFLAILEKSGLDKTLSAYNPNGDDYTLFLPTNEAIDSFIKDSKYATLNDLLNDEDYIWYFSRYHVVNKGIDKNDFPFGAFSEYTLTDDYLAVSFIIEDDSSYYKINNQAPVIRPNIEVSNGYIHIVSRALTPITQTTYGWLAAHDGYELFKTAVDTTGLIGLLNINPKVDEETLPFTLFLEHDSIFYKRGIFSFTQLTNLISPGRTDYSNPLNPLYNWVAYHVLSENMFVDDFQGVSSNYSTYSDIPLSVDGMGIDIKINKGKEMFDTIVHSIGDTTFINYVGINYDASNVITQSGVIHFIDQILKQHPPSRALQTYEFFDRPTFTEYQTLPGTYLIEDSTLLNSITYSGSELNYIKYSEEDNPNGLWSTDCVQLDGDFTFNFKLPKIVQGNYTVYLQADFYSPNKENAVVEIFIDGKKVGGTIDLSSDPQVNASSTNPIGTKEVGTINFIKYDSHTLTVKSLIPGTFTGDFIRFEPK